MPSMATISQQNGLFFRRLFIAQVLGTAVDPVGETTGGREIVEPGLPGLALQLECRQSGVDALLELHEVIGGTDFTCAPELLQQRNAVCKRSSTPLPECVRRAEQCVVAQLSFLQRRAGRPLPRSHAGRGCISLRTSSVDLSSPCVEYR